MSIDDWLPFNTSEDFEGYDCLKEMDGIWETKDGNALKVSAMQTSHIENCVKWLEKNETEGHEPWIDRFEIELRLRKLEEK